ncbi:sensor histidine kinase [Pseudoduganella sp. OTU4001]|uniref:sensor histidine kinase n=1 Tax=Pseudoduganella sp. OTU4001 TaxID=3043854 RepID=UPI00313BD6A6
MELLDNEAGMGPPSDNAIILRLREANLHLLCAALSARDSQAEAEIALTNQDRFFAVLAHELRAPLAPIKLVATSLDTLTATDERLPRLRQTLTRQLDYLVHMVNGLDDVTRIRNGKFALDLQQVRTADVMAAALEMVRPLTEARQQKLTTQFCRDPLLVLGDFDRLVQVFFNLLSNAVKFTPAKGSISVLVARSGASASITVQDNGPGIAPAFLPFVFDMYAQNGAPQNHSRAGSGIGLSLVRSLVEMHGGTVTMGRATPGGGCAATVLLPLTSARPESVTQ